VQEVFPNLVKDGGRGYLTLDYQGFTAPMILAIQEVDLNLETIASTTASSTPASQIFATIFFQNLFARVTSWLASAGNGIADLFATTIHAENVYAKKLCLEDAGGASTCVTKAELDALLAGAAAAGAGGGSSGSSQGGASSPSTTTTAITASADPAAPVITINGNNPATIDVGSTYIDLGATVTDDKDTNLGILASVDGGAKVDLSSIYIDTSTSSTHTIVYSATDNDGNVGTAERTVNVVNPASTLQQGLTLLEGDSATPTATSTATTTDTTSTTTDNTTTTESDSATVDDTTDTTDATTATSTPEMF